MELADFEKDLKEVLEKHNKTLAAIPTKVLGKDGYWHDSAELRWVDLPAEKKQDE